MSLSLPSHTMFSSGGHPSTSRGSTHRTGADLAPALDLGPDSAGKPSQPINIPSRPPPSPSSVGSSLAVGRSGSSFSPHTPLSPRDRNCERWRGTGTGAGIGAILLPFLDRPSEVEDLLCSPQSPAYTQQTAKRMTDLFPGEAGERLWAVLLAPREVLPDALWIAGMYSLLLPRSAELWAKFSGTVGAALMDAEEWMPALGQLVASLAPAAAAGREDGSADEDLARTGAELGKALLTQKREKMPSVVVAAEAVPLQEAAPGMPLAKAVDSGWARTWAGADTGAPPPPPRSPRTRREEQHPLHSGLSLDAGLECVREDPEEAKE